MRKLNKNKGITLISLVITIIVMLILVGVSISMAVNGGLFNYAGKAVGETNKAITDENKIGNGGVTVDGKEFATVDDYLHYADAEDFILTKDNRGKIGYTSTPENLIIPEVFYDETDKKWYKVVEIAADCFSNSDGKTTNLKSVTIPGTVKRIGNMAFYNHGSLNTVILNEGLESIGNGTFQNTGISKINLPNSLKTIDANAFCGCKITNIVIPRGITKLNAGTFTGAKEMTITIPKTVTEIGSLCFWPSEKLTVNYEGTEEEWGQITIAGSNPSLSGDDFSINYNYSYDS